VKTYIFLICAWKVYLFKTHICFRCVIGKTLPFYDSQKSALACELCTLEMMFATLRGLPFGHPPSLAFLAMALSLAGDLDFPPKRPRATAAGLWVVNWHLRAQTSAPTHSQPTPEPPPRTRLAPILRPPQHLDFDAV